MKNLILIALLMSSVSFADQYVNSYYKSDGTYVQGYYRTDANNTKNDNYSTQGNTNPYTGSQGTKPGDSYRSNYGGQRKVLDQYGLNQD